MMWAGLLKVKRKTKRGGAEQRIDFLLHVFY